jgi:hypothetical protein
VDIKDFHYEPAGFTNTKNMIRTHTLAIFCALATLFIFSTVAHAGRVYALIEGTSGLRIRGFTLDEITGVMTPITGLTPLIVDENGLSDGLSPTFVSELLAVDQRNNRVYALNRLNRKVSAFASDPITGALSELPFSPITLPPTLGTPSAVKINPSGTVLAVTEFGNETLAARVTTFLVSASGSTATLAAGSPFAAISFSRSATFSFTGDFFYANGGNGYSVNQTTAQLTPIVGGANTNAWGLSADASGRVFSVSTLIGEVKVSPADNTGTLTGNYVWPPSNVISPLTGAVSGALSPNGRFYAVASPGDSSVGIMAINSPSGATTVSFVGEFDSPQGIFSQQLTYNDTGRMLIVGENPGGSGNRLTAWFTDPSTGELLVPTTTLNNELGGSDAIRGIGYLPGGLPYALGCSANVDADATIRATTDGLAILRSMLNVPGSLTQPRSLSYDVDGDKLVLAEKDGLIFLRAMLGFKDASVTNGINLTNARRKTWPELRGYLNVVCGMNLQ